MLPWYKKKADPKESLPKPLRREGMSITLLTGSQSFQTISNKDIPSFGGAWGGFFFGGGAFTLPVVLCGLHSPLHSERGRG